MIQNYDYFLKWNIQFGKIFTFWKIHIYSKWLTQNMWYTTATICIFNNKLQKISLKNSFIWKKMKKTKKNSQLFL